MLRNARRRCGGRGPDLDQTTRTHEHSHTDVSHLNNCGTFYYLCSILDGCSRAVAGWRIAESMREGDVDLVVQRALEAFPGVRPRAISDDRPQFAADDFGRFVCLIGLTRVPTSTHNTQSDGEFERWPKTLESEARRQETPLSLADAPEVVTAFAAYYNSERLYSALGHVTLRALLDVRRAAVRREPPL